MGSVRLSPPFAISSRLLPAVQVQGAWISCGISGRTTRDGRDVYEAWIDLPNGTEQEVTDLRSGCQGGTVREGMGALLSFLGAAAESYNYRQHTGRTGENEDLFPLAIVEWAGEHEEDLSMLALEIEENPDCIQEGRNK